LSLVLLLFAAASFVVAAAVLMFARSRFLFWLGLAGLFAFFVFTTQPKKLASGRCLDGDVTCGSSAVQRLGDGHAPTVGRPLFGRQSAA
jgi:hypothetical protein